MLASYVGVGGLREEKCVSLIPMCWWASVGTRLPRTYVWVLVGVERNELALYLRVGGCWEECVILVPTCKCVSGGMREPRT